MSKTIVLIKNQVRAYVSDTTSIAQEAMDSHKTNPLPSLIIATAIANFGPLGVMKKYGKLSTEIKSDGAIKSLIVESNVNGDIRALIGDPTIVTEYDKTKFNNIPLQLGIGSKGSIKIVNTVNGKTFGGEVPLANADIVTDLAYYFDQSEQIRTAVQSSIELATPKKLKKAFGVIFQLMPQSNEGDILLIENIIKTKPISKYENIDEYIKDINFDILEEKELRWKCSCSDETVKNLLTMIPQQEKEEIIKEHGKIEVTCGFCNKKYSLKQ